MTHSGVGVYEIGTDFIRVRFREGSVYLYTRASTGVREIEQMKVLAERGEGLTTFISTKVRSWTPSHPQPRRFAWFERWPTGAPPSSRR